LDELFCLAASSSLSSPSTPYGEAKTNQKKYTDEDVACAREDLDRINLREHGSLPEESQTKKISPPFVENITLRDRCTINIEIIYLYNL